VIPVSWDVTGVSALVVGGGTVGLRKATTLANAGADVRTVDPRPVPDHIRWPWACEPYRVGHLAGAKLVVAAAPPEVNERVVADAKAAGIWVCSTSDPASGSFTFPAVMCRGRFTLAVHTDGAAPAFARRVRDELIDRYDDAYGEFVELLGDLRAAVREAVPDPAERRRVYMELSSFAWLDRLRRDGPAATRAAIEAVIRSTH
jgi:precorrin-2 dehydrogenase/sirohydrochlorin ferrochelatase